MQSYPIFIKFGIIDNIFIVIKSMLSTVLLTILTLCFLYKGYKYKNQLSLEINY